jgi:DNA-binding CsgD family transcriptional regulator
VSMFLAELELRAGHLDAARPLAEDRVASRAMLAAYEGDVGLARELAERGLADSEAGDDAILAAANRTALGFVELSLGNNGAAVQRFAPILERFLAGEGGDPGLRHNIIIPDAIEALVALGRTDEAEQALAAWERAGELFDRPRIHATAARCRALIAAGEGDLPEAIARAEAALEHHRDLPVPFERARTLIALGTLHRRAKHKAAARAALEEAVAILEQIGVPLWAERARTELARIGGRAAAGGLTPTEQRVADLVAGGRSNKEVAAELFVSVRTVEANLTRVYAKLGIRSRTELASRRGR